MTACKNLIDAPCLTKITLDNWRCFGQVEVLSTAGGTLSITGDVIDNWRYFGQLSVLPTTGDPMKTVVQKPNEFSIPRGALYS